MVLLIFRMEWLFMEIGRDCICYFREMGWGGWGDVGKLIVFDKYMVNACLFLKINRYLAVFSVFLVILVINWL